jgi:hypothetical protein
MSHDPPVVYYNLFNGIMVHEMSFSPLKSLGEEMFQRQKCFSAKGSCILKHNLFFTKEGKNISIRRWAIWLYGGIFQF